MDSVQQLSDEIRMGCWQQSWVVRLRQVERYSQAISKRLTQYATRQRWYLSFRINLEVLLCDVVKFAIVHKGQRDFAGRYRVISQRA